MPRKSSAEKVLDASGLIVAPGFVDLHTHYDAQIQWDPYCTVSSWHGVTSVVIGNCGFGFAPCAPKQADRDRLMLSLTRNEAIPYEPMKLGMLWDWVTFPDFLDSLERIPKGLNLISYVPLTPIYAWVMGYDEAKRRRPTEAELKEMCRLVDEGMDAGACGWSAQVLGATSVQRDSDGTPMITDLMTPDELVAFARVLAERGDGTIEMSQPGNGVPNRPVGEDERVYERVAEAGNRPILYQEVFANSNFPEKHREQLRWLEQCAEKRLRVYGQAGLRRTGFELTFEDWNLFDESPTWLEVTLGSVEEKKAKMEDPQRRAALKAEWDAGLGPQQVVMGSVAALTVEEVQRPDFEHYVGQTVAQIAEQEGKHVIDALLDIVVRDNLKTEFWGPEVRNNAEFAAEIVKSPYTVSGISDGGAHVRFIPGGTYPTDVLAWLVRDEGLVSLEEAHYKLSYLNAWAGGFKDRGFLREGAPADIVVYDLDKLALAPSEIAHDLPGGDWRRIQRAEGYRWIMVNGEVTFEDGNPTGALPGRLLRHGRG